MKKKKLGVGMVILIAFITLILLIVFATLNAHNQYPVIWLSDDYGIGLFGAYFKTSMIQPQCLGGPIYYDTNVFWPLFIIEWIGFSIINYLIISKIKQSKSLHKKEIRAKLNLKTIVITTLVSWTILAGLFSFNAITKFPMATVYINYDKIQVGFFGPNFYEFYGDMTPKTTVGYTMKDPYDLNNGSNMNIPRKQYRGPMYRFDGVCWPVLIPELILFPVIGCIIVARKRKVKCPLCHSKHIYKVIWEESPDLSIDELEIKEKEMEKKMIVFGPNDKKYYCKQCDYYFGESK